MSDLRNDQVDKLKEAWEQQIKMLNRLIGEERKKGGKRKPAAGLRLADSGGELAQEYRPHEQWGNGLEQATIVMDGIHL